MKRRIIVVGLGSIGRRHARLLAERGDLAVEACETSDGMVGQFAREIGNCRVFRDYGAALDTRPEMVVIATPHGLHRDQSVRALERGINVLCEKPLSHDLASAREIHQAALSSSAVMCVGFMLQFHPVMRRVAELVRSGELGNVLAARYLVGAYETLVNSVSRYQEKLEGALLMDYAHQPDIIHWLLGRRPAGVYAAGVLGGELPFKSDPNILSLVCDYHPPDLLVNIDLNYVQSPTCHEFALIGDRAWVSCDMVRGRLCSGKRENGRETEELFHAERDEMYRAEHQAFMDAVDGRRPPFRSAAEALVSMEVIDAALRSCRERRRVDL